MKFKVLWQGQLPKVSVFWTLCTAAAFRVYRLSVNQKKNVFAKLLPCKLNYAVFDTGVHLLRVTGIRSLRSNPDRSLLFMPAETRALLCIPHPKKVRNDLTNAGMIFACNDLYHGTEWAWSVSSHISLYIFTGSHFLSVWNRKLLDISIASEANAWNAAFASRLLCRPTTGFPSFFPPLCLDIKQQFD